ncbi:MAG: hypothetical protein ACI93N_001950 [Flavobacteriaceae bacterium]|jgi:hypothetical protein
MGVKKDIGKAYNERLKNLEATPNENVWEKIQSSLETKKKNKILLFWFRIVGTGLLILLLGGGIYKMSLKNSNDPSSIEKNETITPIKNNELLISDSNKNNHTKTDVKDNLNEDLLNSDSISDSNSNLNLNSGIKNKTLKNHNSTNKNISKSKYSESKNNLDTLKNTNSLNKSNSNSQNSITNNSIKNNSNNKIDNNLKNSKKYNFTINSNNKVSENKINNTEKGNKITSDIRNLSGIDNSISDLENKINLEKQLVKDSDSTFKKDTLLVASKKDSLPKKKLLKKNSQWEVGAYIIPTYFGSLSKVSSLGEILEDSEKQANITLSYRILGHFKLSEKLTLRTGFGNTKLSYTKLDATATDMNGELENLGAFPGVSYDFIELSEIYLADLLGTSSTVDFKQELTYFEIPVELIYRIPKNKIEWKIFAGSSFFKLSENKIIAESSKGSYYIGGANNLSKYSYSVNLGAGFDYQVSDKVNLTLEPIFKYHINTFNRKVYNFKPISVGVSFGATYKF